MNRIEGGGLSWPSAGGAVFGGPLPAVDNRAAVDARLSEIARLQAENAAMKASLQEVQDYAAKLATGLSDSQIALAQANAQIERLKVELVNAKSKAE